MARIVVFFSALALLRWRVLFCCRLTHRYLFRGRFTAALGSLVEKV